MSLFLLNEIGFDTSLENENSLIDIAEEHRKSYDDERTNYPKIITLDQALKYFNDYGFKVIELNNDSIDVLAYDLNKIIYSRS